MTSCLQGRVGQRDLDWLNRQVGAYLDLERPAYLAFARLMEVVLGQVKREVAPLAFVGTRVKQPDSFAEKCLRRRGRLEDPVNQLEDLCGARIVVSCLDEIEPVCRRVGELLEIEAIEDKAELHHETEFGYLSIHFTVKVDPDRLQGMLPPDGDDWIQGINGPDSTGQPRRRAAELQVRTLLQHAWSDLTHDRIYKTRVRIPAEYRREWGRLAAMLETADARFSEFARKIDAYKERYAAYLEPAEIVDEIEHLECVRHNQQLDPDDRRKLALRIAKLARARGDWDLVVERCRGLDADPEARFLTGEAKCLKHSANPAHPEFAEGLAILDGIDIDSESDSLAAEILARRAWAKARAEALSPEELRDLRYRAWVKAPHNPYHFKEFLEAAVISEGRTAAADLLRVQIETAIDACREHIRVGIELPHAHFALGQLLLLHRHARQALDAYIEGMGLESADELVEDEWRSLDKICKAFAETSADLPAAFPIATELLALANLARKARTGDAGQIRESANAMDLHPARRTDSKPICIVVGRDDPDQASAGQSELIEAAFAGFRGTRIPDPIRDDETPGPQIPSGTESDLPICGPIRLWIDLLAAGVPPSAVRVLGIGGGPSARTEYELALALGATVGLLEGSGGSADPRLAGKSSHPRLLVLPRDAASVWSFLRVDHPDADLTAHEATGRAIHEVYRQTKRENLLKSLKVETWNELSEGFKQSNLHQAAFAPAILEASGFRVVAVDAPGQDADLGTEEIEAMARKEHGRWCIERLMLGWTAGPRDDARKIHPNLVPWHELDENTRNYDINTVRSWPRVLAETGQKIIRT